VADISGCVFTVSVCLFDSPSIVMMFVSIKRMHTPERDMVLRISILVFLLF